MIRISRLLVILSLLQLVGTPVATAQRFFDTKGMGLMKGQQPGTAKLNYGDSQAAAIKALGKPTKTAKMYFEMDNDMATVYYYRVQPKLSLRRPGWVEGFNVLAYQGPAVTHRADA